MDSLAMKMLMDQHIQNLTEQCRLFSEGMAALGQQLRASHKAIESNLTLNQLDRYHWLLSLGILPLDALALIDATADELVAFLDADGLRD